MVPRPAPAGRIDARAALDGTETRLLDLLDGLGPDEWDQPTIVPSWRVRHVAGHLLDTALRRLTIARDGFVFDRPASAAPDDVRAFVDRVNAEGVQVYGRLSPSVLRDMMQPASQALRRWLAARAPDAPALFPVSWAGETASAHWFDAARELTERWHHQQQIRLALDRPGLFGRELYHPVLDCFMRALPYSFRDLDAPDGAHVAVEVTGEAGGIWRLYRDGARWMLTTDVLDQPVARVTLPEHIAWRLFTKGIAPEAARHDSRVEGDPVLAARVFATRAIVG